MPSATQISALSVCLIEPNPLALEFLTSLLRRDSTIRILRIEDLAGHSGKGPTPTFVVDNFGLPLPLSECLRSLRFHHPNSKCVLLDHELSTEDLLRLLWMKIDGYLPYGEVPRSLLAAVHSVAEGKLWIPREVLREHVQWGQELRQKDTSNLDWLTPRENQIIELVKRRLSNQEIAEILRIRECTVKFHLSNIYSKLRVGGRRELIESSLKSSGFESLLQVLTRLGSEA